MSHRAISLVVVGGLDPSGGAGIIRDFLTAKELGVHVTIVGTAWTIQTSTGVAAVEPREGTACGQAIRNALKEAVSTKTAVKVGMVADGEIVNAVVAALTDFSGPIVFDPVMGATSGGRALFSDSPSELAPLFRRATLTTPNLAEAAALVGFPVDSIADMEKAGLLLLERGMQAVLLKGGHLSGDAKDVLFTRTGTCTFLAPRIPEKNPRGTGCALATAIAAFLAEGLSLDEAVDQGKKWLWRRIRDASQKGTEWYL